jgi:hypothetical protein
MSDWFGWVADNAGCAWYRSIVPLTAIQKLGLVDKVSHSMISSGAELLSRDVVIAQRTCNENANPMLWKMTELGAGWTYDLDDLLWGVEHTNVNAHGFYSQDWVQDLLMRTIAAAPQISVSTEELANELDVIGYRGAVQVLPNTVPDLPGLARDPENEPVDRDGKRKRPLKVLWAGSRTHDADLEIIRYTTKKLVERGDIELILMGVDYSDLIPWASKSIPWVANHEYIDALAAVGADVMLCPVKPGKFNAAKSHLKALDAMAAGIIPLESDYCTYNRLVVHGESGLLAKWNEHDWHKKLQSLVAMNWDELHAMREACLLRASDYSADKWAPAAHSFWAQAPVNCSIPSFDAEQLKQTQQTPEPSVA